VSAAGPRSKSEEMLPEYDFSAGVRGKYASRFAKDKIEVVLVRVRARKAVGRRSP